MDKVYIRFPNFRRKVLTLSYDDGVRQDKRLISILQKHGLKCTFNINAGLFGDKYVGKEVGRMTKQEVLNLYLPAGMEVAIHGYKHLPLPLVDIAVATNDVCTDRKELERMFGCIIKGMAYAYGRYSDDIVNMLKMNGVNYARTTISTEKFDITNDWLRLPATCHHNNPRLMELAKQFIEQSGTSNEPQMFYLWGHSYEFDNDNNWNIIEEFAKYIGNREDIWYATNGEIFDYLKACERLEFSIDGTFVRNPSCIDVWIDYMGKKDIIPAGKVLMIK